MGKYSSHTREEMEAMIARGEGVIYRGAVITTIEGLPSKVELAEGNPQENAQLQSDLQAQLASIQEQLDSLQAPPPEDKPEATEDEFVETVPPEEVQAHATSRKK